jgi:hypothetical protein
MLIQDCELEIMKIINEKLKSAKSYKHCFKVLPPKNRRTITEDSLLSFWDNEYDEVWNEC